MKQYSIVGSINIDMVTRVANFPSPGETVDGIAFNTFFGGKGANQAVALARLGARVVMIGKVGGDAFGLHYRERFAAMGVEESEVGTATETSTGTASIEVNGEGENHIIVVAGANGAVVPAYVEEKRSVIEASDFLLLQLEIPLESVIKAAEIARARGATVILDPAPARLLPSRLLSNVSIITPNETEARILTGIDTATDEGIRKAGSLLLGSGVGTVIIKAGSRGAFLVREGIFRRIGGYRVDAVDTTAAGDSFNAGLARALGEGKDFEEAIAFANAVAALSTTKPGAQEAMPSSREVSAFIARSSRVSG
jgi:ribokinase